MGNDVEPIEVRRRIREITKEVKRRRIVERAYALAKLGKKTVREGGDYTTISYEFQGGDIRVYKSSFNYGPDFINVDYHRSSVFYATFSEINNRIRIVRVEKFVDGPWVDELDLQGIQRAKEAKDAMNRIKEEARRMKGNHPLSKEEELQAASLGII